MLNSRADIMRQLLEMFNGFDADSIKNKPGFKARIHIRDRLIPYFSIDKANELVAALEIDLDDDILDDEDERVLAYQLFDAMAYMLIEAHKAIKTEIDSWPLFLKMMEGANLQLRTDEG